MQAGRFWQAITIRLRRCTLMLVALYLQPNLAPVGENMRRLAMLWKFLALTRLPWVIIGDWNCEPADLIPTGWLTQTSREPKQKCAKRNISWRLECVTTGAQNTRDRVTRPSWHQRMYLQVFTIHWNAILSDTHGGQDGGVCRKPVLRNFLLNPDVITEEDMVLVCSSKNCESLRAPDRLYELMALAKLTGAEVACLQCTLQYHSWHWHQMCQYKHQQHQCPSPMTTQCRHQRKQMTLISQPPWYSFRVKGIEKSMAANQLSKRRRTPKDSDRVTIETSGGSG